MRCPRLIGAVWLVLAVPASAVAAGGPVPPVQGGSGITAAGTAFRYVASTAGRNTAIARLGPGAGHAGSDIRVAGRYGIPGADFNGSTTGLSADGRTLVLAELPGSRRPRTTQLLVLDTPRLAVRARIVLPGFSTVDAVSPHGRWLYLIHFLSSDANKYEVRAYDLPARRLVAAPVVDPHDHGEAMTGIAISRVMSADGRWAYTLYMRPPEGAPFVHALDTARRRAVCVDLPSIPNTDLGDAHLGLEAHGTALRVDVAGITRAAVDTRTFAVTPAPAKAASGPVRPARQVDSSAGGVPWELVAPAVAVLAAIAALAAIARRRSRPGVT
jgi:hypothetical protein